MEHEHLVWNFVCIIFIMWKQLFNQTLLITIFSVRIPDGRAKKSETPKNKSVCSIAFSKGLWLVFHYVNANGDKKFPPYIINLLFVEHGKMLQVYHRYTQLVVKNANSVLRHVVQW